MIANIVEAYAALRSEGLTVREWVDATVRRNNRRAGRTGGSRGVHRPSLADGASWIPCDGESPARPTPRASRFRRTTDMAETDCQTDNDGDDPSDSAVQRLHTSGTGASGGTRPRQRDSRMCRRACPFRARPSASAVGDCLRPVRARCSFRSSERRATASDSAAT